MTIRIPDEYKNKELYLIDLYQLASWFNYQQPHTPITAGDLFRIIKKSVVPVDVIESEPCRCDNINLQVMDNHKKELCHCPELRWGHMHTQCEKHRQVNCYSCFHKSLCSDVQVQLDEALRMLEEKESTVIKNILATYDLGSPERNIVLNAVRRVAPWYKGL